MSSQTEERAIDRTSPAPATGSAVRSAEDAAHVVFLTADEWLGRPVESLLSHDRYRLSVVQQARELLDCFLHGRTDAVLIDLKFTADSGTDMSALLWEVPREPMIPVIAIGRESTSRGARLDALNAGVWDVIDFPLPPAELLAKLDTYVWLKRRFDQMSAGVLLDLETSHYSVRGIKRRLRELVSLAQRTGEAFSCVVFGADPMAESVTLTSRMLQRAGREFSLALHHQTRSSDIVGRLEPLKFAVLAPHTPPEGAIRLAGRLTSWSVTRRLTGDLPVTFSAGVAGVSGKNGQVYARPELLLTAAHRALNSARSEGAAQVVMA